MKLPIAALRTRLAAERGVAAVEFSIVAVFFLIFLFGIITFGFIFALDNSLTHLSAEAARASVSKPTAAEQIDHAKITAYERMPGWIRNKMDRNGDGAIDAADAPAELTAEIQPCANAPTQNCIHVHLGYPWGEDPVVRPMPGFGIVTPDLITADAFVQVD